MLHLPAIERMMLIRTAWGLMFKHAAVGRSLGGRSHLCLVEPNFVLDLLPLLLRHAPEFNGWKEESWMKHGVTWLLFQNLSLGSYNILKKVIDQ